LRPRGGPIHAERARGNDRDRAGRKLQRGIKPRNASADDEDVGGQFVTISKLLDHGDLYAALRKRKGRKNTRNRR
jgi:hypothetical protein